jgi:hypothetical protein
VGFSHLGQGWREVERSLKKSFVSAVNVKSRKKTSQENVVELDKSGPDRRE